MTVTSENFRFIAFVLAALVLISPLLLNYHFLSAHQEFKDISEIAADQQGPRHLRDSNS